MHLPVEGMSGQVAWPCDLGDARPPGPCRHGGGALQSGGLAFGFQFIAGGGVGDKHPLYDPPFSVK